MLRALGVLVCAVLCWARDRKGEAYPGMMRGKLEPDEKIECHGVELKNEGR